MKIQGAFPVRWAPSNGTDGKDSITLDLDNEIDSVPCDLLLQTTSPSNQVYTTLTLYKGATAIDMGIPVIVTSSTALGVELVSTSGFSKRYKVTVNDGAGLTEAVTFKVFAAGVTRNAVFTVNKIKPGANGEPAVIYRVEPSVTAVKVSKTGTATPTKVTCKKTKQIGNGTPSETTEGYLCVRLSGSTTDKPYSDYGTGGVPVSGQTSIDFILYKSTADKTVLDRETVPVIVDGEDGEPGKDGTDGQDGLSIHANLLRQTVFDPAHMDMWDQVADNNVAQGLQYRNALHFNPKLDSTYTDALQQPIDGVVEPGKWYTLSFYAKTREFYTVMQQITSASYGFAGVPIYLKAGNTVTVRVRGYCSQAALSAGRYLRVYLFKDGWSWNKYVDIKSTSLTLATITANDVPSDGLYHIQAYVYPEASASAPAQTAYVYSYDINRGGEIRTHVYPACIDTTAGCYVDGEFSNNVAVDGAMDYVLTTGFNRHSYSFKMKNPIPTTSICKALFRMTEASNEVWICMPKLEEGIHATDYMPNDLDISETAADQTGFPVDTGVFDNTRVYKWDDVSRDFMKYEFDGQYYKFGVKYKGMTVPAGNPPASVNGDSNWEAGNRYSILIANTVFGTNANIGGFLTSDSVMKSQNESLVLDGRFGTINLKHSDGTEWYVDENGMQTLGDRDGQRIELNPAQRAMSIYNQKGEQVAVFEGNNYDSISSLFGNTSGSMDYRIRTSEEAGYTSGVTMARGSLSKNTQGTAEPRKGKHKYALTDGFSTDAPVEIEIASGVLYTRAHGGHDYFVGIGLTYLAHSDVSIQLRVATYTDSTKSNLKGYVVVNTCSINARRRQDVNSQRIITNARVKTATGGFHVLEISYAWYICGSGSEFYAHWGSTTSDSDSSGLSVPTYSSDFYVSRYFANGFCLGTSARNYFWLRNNNGNMVFEGISGDYGFKVDKDGVMMKHHNGNYQMIPQIILWGYVTTANSTTTPVTASLKTFDGSTFSTSATSATINTGVVKRVNTGSLRISFPISWQGMNLSKSNSFVTLTGYQLAMKGTLTNFNEKYIDVSISDDETVFIKIEKLM